MANPKRILQVGDLVWSNKGYLALEPPAQNTTITVIVGKVAEITGTTVKLKHVPLTVVSEKLRLYAVSFPRIHPVTTGTLASGSTTITSVGPADKWHAGQRIRGQGIPEGAYIQGVDVVAGTLTISAPATAPRAAKLYDADVRAITNTPV